MVAAAPGEVPVSCNPPVAPSLGLTIILEPSIPLDPGDAVVQQASLKARRADVSTILSSSHKMNRVEREDKGCCHELARKFELVSTLVQTPSDDCSSLLPNLKAQNCKHQLLQVAQSNAEAPEDFAQSEKDPSWPTTSCRGSSSMAVPSDERPSIHGDVVAAAGGHMGDEHMLLSKRSSLKENGEWLLADGYNATPYADISTGGVLGDEVVAVG